MASLPRHSLFAVGAIAFALLTGCATDEIKGSNPIISAAKTTAQFRPADSLTIALQCVPAKESKVSLVRAQTVHDLNARLAQQNPAHDPRLIPGDSP
ncbi:MAG: hypothetical protein CK538_06745 [Opitutia bacterium]|nr:hypothetical protein [Opitutaceae bacterium]PHX85436.1 MAG: hypothetical protein CK538_06745 [Opitutae bacterium]